MFDVQTDDIVRLPGAAAFRLFLGGVDCLATHLPVSRAGVRGVRVAEICISRHPVSRMRSNPSADDMGDDGIKKKF